MEVDCHGQRWTAWFLWKEGVKLSDIYCWLSAQCGEKTPAAPCSVAYGGSAVSRKLHWWVSVSGIASLLTNGSLKPCRSSEGNGNDV